MNPTRGRQSAALAFALSASLALGAISCGDSTSRRVEVLLAQQQTTISDYLSQLEAALPDFVEAKAIQHAPAALVDTIFGDESLDLPIDPRHLDRLNDFYIARNYEPLFLEGDQLADRGVGMAQALISADRHGIQPDDVHASAIRDALERASSDASGSMDRSAIGLSEGERETLRAWLLSVLEEQEALPELNTTLEVIAGDAATSPLPRLAALVRDAEIEPSEATLALLELDILLADGWLKFGILQRFGNLRYVDTETAHARKWQIIVDGQEYSTRQPGSVRRDPELDPATLTRISGEDVALTFAMESLEAAAEHGDFATAFEALYPPFEQYRLLLQSSDRYRELVRKGGWETLPDETTALRVGDSGPLVRALRERLYIEGYLDEVGGDSFDSTLRSAVLEYQTTHQLSQAGTVTEPTLTSINISAERRLAQILVTMGHYRVTRIGEDFDDEYILVNVPDFHVELWDKEELITRMTSVVGRTRVLSGGRIEGRTVLFSDELNYVVFNPYWNVPVSMWNADYAAKIAEDPFWLQDNGFEIITTSEGGQLLRQLPSPNNALGLVKFLFPNEHDIYLHDTPQKHLFAHSHRAYSAGCIRVQGALDFARLLLQRDRDITERAARAEVNRMLARPDEQWITLRRFIPVHIEYFVVRVNEDGHTEFLSDLHRTDRPLVDEKEAEIQTWLERLSAQQANLAPAEEPAGNEPTPL